MEEKQIKKKETYSHSRLSTFENCPLRYRLRYIDKIKSDLENIEGFVGGLVHKSLEKFYRHLQYGKLNTKEELIAHYQQLWDQRFHQGIRIVKKDYQPENYNHFGRLCLERYYDRNAPFDKGKTLHLEKEVKIELDPEKGLSYMGYIDRLVEEGDGVYQIHDYKTSSSLPGLEDLKSDRQLPMYELAVREMFPDAKKVDLIWHFLAFGKEFKLTKKDKELEKVLEEVILLIERIEKEEEFPPCDPGKRILCAWCEYQGICPEMKHKVKVRNLPPTEVKEEQGVVLAERYAQLIGEKKRIEGELQRLKERIISFAEKEKVSVVQGLTNRLRIKKEERLKFPTKNDAPEERRKLEELIKESGCWERLSTLSSSAIERAISERALPDDLSVEIKKYARKEESFSLYLSKISREEEEDLFS
jgi:putative RecB family exonuclease